MIKLRDNWRDVKIGSTFNRLVVLGVQFRLCEKWACVVECKCGKVKVVFVYDLPSKHSESCGCLHKERVAVVGRSRRKHGQSNSPLHKLWMAIKSRCADKNDKIYGGRGISVCEEWIGNFEPFRDFAMSHGYQLGLQIDRYPDVDGDYSPSNVRFVTAKENDRNRRVNRFITAWGETKCFSEWSEDVRCKVSARTLNARFSKKDCNVTWNPESAIATPPRPGRRTPPCYAGTPEDVKSIYEVRGLKPRNHGQRNDNEHIGSDSVANSRPLDCAVFGVHDLQHVSVDNAE